MGSKPLFNAQWFFVASCVFVASAIGNGGSLSRVSTLPSLGVLETALLTTAKGEFGGDQRTFEAAAARTADRNHQHHTRAPHLCCTDYDHGREAYSRLQGLLSAEAVRPVVHSEQHGACYLVTVTHAHATSISQNLRQYRLASFAPFPSALKIAPGLLEHEENPRGDDATSKSLGRRLGARHGSPMRRDDVEGLSVELAPGILPAHSAGATFFVEDMLEDLVSESLDLHATNFWSDPAVQDGEEFARAGGAVRRRDWSKAAAVVQGLSESASTSPADICSWNTVVVHHAGDDLLLVSGLDHLLFSGRGAGGRRHEGEAAELHVACYMGLLSFLADRPEVVRVAPRYAQGLLNASARANIQSATVIYTPLTDAGLDGTGEVIQIIDSGLDESSCYFANDENGSQVKHGYYYDEWGANFDLTPPVATDDDTWWQWPGAKSHAGSESTGSSYYSTAQVFTGGDFTVYPNRRKIIQYINLVKSDDIPGSYGDYFRSSGGQLFPWLPAEDFEYDDIAGHGTHTAGSAAGATLTYPAEPATCEAGKVVSCVGGCIDGSAWYATDDLVTTSTATFLDIDRLCPAFGCDDSLYEECLSDDVSETLTNNGGMAQGAKLAIFDGFYGEFGLMGVVGNGLWEPCAEAGCKLHSNSWGSDHDCQLGPTDVLYDDFMYKNPENLLIFAAGNIGDEERTSCTISSPAITKNVLAVGATTSGNTRLSTTGLVDPEVDDSGIDTVAYFSSTGPTADGRIKPEVVAPGDMIYSAASDGSADSYTCRLWAYAGTSMSCPIVAGAAAMVRQYFVDNGFYSADVAARGLCGDGFRCEGFSPSSATVKALLINSANLMGGSSEPDGSRGFGRIHLDAGMPLAGNGSLVLFVADSADTFIPELTRQEYKFTVDAKAARDFRATLSWIDPPATTFSVVQLVHDLDLAVVSPRGVRHTMWASGVTDTVNNNERVIVDAKDVESGVWVVWVWAKRLTTDTQSYSLVVNGAISTATVEAASKIPTPTPSSNANDTSVLIPTANASTPSPGDFWVASTSPTSVGFWAPSASPSSGGRETAAADGTSGGSVAATPAMLVAISSLIVCVSLAVAAAGKA